MAKHTAQARLHGKAKPRSGYRSTGSLRLFRLPYSPSSCLRQWWLFLSCPCGTRVVVQSPAGRLDLPPAGDTQCGAIPWLAPQLFSTLRAIVGRFCQTAHRKRTCFASSAVLDDLLPTGDERVNTGNCQCRAQREGRESQQRKSSTGHCCGDGERRRQASRSL